MLRTIIVSALLLAAVLATGGGIAFLKYRRISAEQSVPPPPEMPEAVLTAIAVETVVRQQAVSIGTVLAPQSLHVRSELVGIVQSIAMVSGSVVEPNDLLVQFDTSVEQAELAGARASQKIANSTYQRTLKAAQANASTQLELEQSEAALALANAEVTRLNAIIGKKTLRAPFRARVGLFDVHPGQYMQEGTEITMLQGVDNFVNVDFSMPQQVADSLRLRDKVTLDSNPGIIHAEIAAIDSQADRLTRGIKARARVDNPPETMQPNDSVRVRMDYGPEIAGVLVPSAALRRSPSGAFVFTADINGNGELRAHQQEVFPGGTYGDDVMILKGIEAGQRIVSDGSFKVHEGSLLAEMANARTVATSVGTAP